MEKSVCPACGRAILTGEGRRLSLTDAQIEGILRHYYAEYPELTQRAYCEQAGISVMTYWRITRLRLKHLADRARIIGIVAAIGYDMGGISASDKPAKE